MRTRKIAFIGAGKIVHAMIKGLITSSYPADHISVSAPSDVNKSKLKLEFNINTSSNNIAAANDAKVIVLAVKPQIMADVMEPLQSIDLSDKLIISVAAGISCARLNKMLDQQLNLVRIMPNVAANIGQSMTGVFTAVELSDDDRKFIEQMIKSIGILYWLKKESDLNYIIAAAGSSPAYFFHFMDAMVQEMQAQGFDSDTSRLLVQQSALGAAMMAIDATGQYTLKQLQDSVTSKGGTTAQALEVFTQEKLSDTVAKAMQAAVNRAISMEQLF